jgi:allantoinase
LKKLDIGDFKQAWGGIASVSLALSAVWTKASENGFAMSDIARWMAEKPAELAGISSLKGKIAAGYDADFAIFDAAEEWQPTPDVLHFKHKVSPYLGERLKGRVAATFLRGQCVYNGDFPPQHLGRECRVG